MRIRDGFGTIVSTFLAILGGGVSQSGCSSGPSAPLDFAQVAYDACVASVPKPEVVSAPADGQDTLVRAGLVSGDLDAADASMRRALVARMHQDVENSRYSAIVEARCASKRPNSDVPGGDVDAGSAGDMPPPSRGPSEPSQVSGTNNQVAGVDEADFVKNDGHYIYATTGSSLHIVEAWPAAGMHEVGHAALDGTALKLFVVGDRAVVYSSVAKPDAPSNGSSSSYGPIGACTYGYDCDFSGDGTGTVLSLLDITDRAHPRILRKIRTSASLIAARRIGNAVHTVMGQLSKTPSYPTYPDQPNWKSEQDIQRAFDALIAKNEETLAAVSLRDQLPTIDLGAGSVPVSNLLQSTLPDGVAFTTVLSLDMVNDGAPVNSVTVLSRPGAVYASAKALYVAVPHERSNYGWFEGSSDLEASSVHKFAIGDSPLSTQYLATGVVKGRVLNQFSMDEKDDHLRIATTSGHLPGPDVYNTLSVLEQQGPELTTSGRIDQIAKGEDIRSVRFDGDRGFMVTFKKTDPLYAFDLSNPHAPATLGELKIPGFSTYMHVMDATHLLTIGYDANDHDTFAYFDGVILQIFDVSNPQSPTLVQKEKIGTRGSSSEALADHLAFNYFVPKGELALPMTICEGGGDGTYGTDMTFSGLMVYDVSVEHGFSLRGKVSHPNAPNGSGYDSGACTNWWSDASSEVKRSIFMDDVVYSISSSRIKANQLAALATDVSEVSIR